MIHWPVVLVLDHSVTIGESEEVLTLCVSMGFDVLWVIFSELSLVSSSLLILEWGEYFGSFDLSVYEELVKGRLSDGDDLLDNVPEDSLGEWRCGEGSLVGPPSVVVKLGYEGCHVNFCSKLIGKHCAQKLVVEVINFIVFKIVFLDCSEKEA